MGTGKSRKADAWVLYAGDPDQRKDAKLVRENIEIPAPGPGEVIAEPIYGCWEGNMGHALKRKPVDICLLRNEPKVVIGNAGVLRVVEVGPDVTSVAPGQHAILFCNGIPDRFGYPEKILGYDAPGTMGCLSTFMKLGERQLIPIPENTRHGLEQWAAFSLRYVTAWSNWELAYGTFRLQVPKSELESPHVWGWGGGVSRAELELAQRQGCRTVMLSGRASQVEEIRRAGIHAIDRTLFGELDFDPVRYKKDGEYREAYKKAEAAFVSAVREQTDGEMVHIFLDYVGAPVYRATLKALSREGVITTAGWKEGMGISLLRAIECIDRHQHVHTHYARYSQGVDAVAYAEASGWVPEVDARIFGFDEIPALAEAYEAGETGYFPCFSVNA